MEKISAESKLKLNMVVWLIVLALLGAGVVASYYFREVAWALRFAAWVVLVCGVMLLVLRTREGKKVWVFVKDARVELRKVVWPTQQETVRTTMVVASMVIVMALILWGLDSILLWLVGRLAG